MSFDLKISGGDLVLNKGDLQKVVDGEKLIQDLLKIALTPAGSNPSFPWYGSLVSRTLIGSAIDTSIILQVGQSQLQNAIQNLKQLQEAQGKTGQIITADEQIKSILDISINRGVTDPRLFNVRIKVLSKGFKGISANFQINPL